MDILPLIIQLVSGAVGGNVVGSTVNHLSLGTLGNSIVGILGGGLGGTILQSLLGIGGESAGMDIGSILSNIAGGGVGGGVLLAIVGVIKNMMGKK